MVNKKRKLLFQIFSVLFLLMVAIVAVTPFIYLLITSFITDMSLLFKNGIAL